MIVAMDSGLLAALGPGMTASWVSHDLRFDRRAENIRGTGAPLRAAASRRRRAHDAGFPFDVAQLMAKQGLLGITLPENDGGQGGALIDAVIAIEQIAAV